MTHESQAWGRPTKRKGVTGTKLYVVMVADRHLDPQPCVFSTEAAAVGYAREIARDWLVEYIGGGPAGWLFYAKHPTEDDAVWVQPVELDNPESGR